MLSDLINDLIAAVQSKDKVRTEAAFKALERVGMDRYTAIVAASETYKRQRKQNQ